MTPRDLIDDLRSRINPAYAAQLGTESYERRLCAEALEAQADEIDALRATMVDLLEILRQWEPDHSSGEHRRRIVLAMYQIGVLHDPTATVAAMQTQNAEVSRSAPLLAQVGSTDGLERG